MLTLRCRRTCVLGTQHYVDDSHLVELPPVKVVIVLADNDLSIKISDEGGGIPLLRQGDLFDYFFTTALIDPFSNQDEVATMNMNHAPLAGYGYGLPISRLYAR